MSRSTPLLAEHESAGARLVDFAGWQMPIHYGSQIAEHHAVRRAAGMFDVSHMTVVDLRGPRCTDYLRHLLANDVARIQTPGRALYSCMLAADGGVLDDLIVYFDAPDHYRMVVNAATRDKDLAWLRQQAVAFHVEVTERDDLAMIAVQGPEARERAAGQLPGAGAAAALALKPFNGVECGSWFVARTGYTGEDGWEIILPAADAPALWRGLRASGVEPCGLGARDTLRLEAGLNLYGSDMDEATTPLESALGWTVAMDPPDRDFIGRAALEAQKAAGVPRKLVGLLLEARGVLRHGQTVLVDDVAAGVITSGTYSPTLERAIALARVPATTGQHCCVDIRGRQLPARVVRPPFVRGGEIKIEL